MRQETHGWARTGLLVRFVFPAVLATLSIGAAGLPNISLRVSPDVAMKTLERLHIEVVIPRHAENVAWCLTVDGPGLYTSSCGNLHGEQSPAVIVRDVLALREDGEYAVIAELYRRGTGSETPFDRARKRVLIGVLEADAER
jgi:hypothetical protein